MQDGDPIHYPKKIPVIWVSSGDCAPSSPTEPAILSETCGQTIVFLHKMCFRVGLKARRPSDSIKQELRNNQNEKKGSVHPLQATHILFVEEHIK